MLVVLRDVCSIKVDCLLPPLSQLPDSFLPELRWAGVDPVLDVTFEVGLRLGLLTGHVILEAEEVIIVVGGEVRGIRWVSDVLVSQQVQLSCGYFRPVWCSVVEEEDFLNRGDRSRSSFRFISFSSLTMVFEFIMTPLDKTFQ